MKTIDNYNIQIKVLLRVYKEFKLNSKKVFIAKDFFKASPRLTADRYLTTLKRLGLIIQVPVKYYCGKQMRMSKETRGYKLK